MLESFQQAKTPSEMSRSWKLAAKRQIDLLFLFVGFVVAHFPRCCTIPITARQCSASNFPRGSWLQNPWPDPVWWHEKFCLCQQASNGQMAFSLRSVIISSFEPVLSPPGVDRFPITFFCYRAYTPNPSAHPLFVCWVLLITFHGHGPCNLRNRVFARQKFAALVPSRGEHNIHGQAGTDSILALSHWPVPLLSVRTRAFIVLCVCFSFLFDFVCLFFLSLCCCSLAGELCTN